MNARSASGAFSASATRAQSAAISTVPAPILWPIARPLASTRPRPLSAKRSSVSGRARDLTVSGQNALGGDYYAVARVEAEKGAPLTEHERSLLDERSAAARTPRRVKPEVNRPPAPPRTAPGESP